jgi:hypothetical protein
MGLLRGDLFLLEDPAGWRQPIAARSGETPAICAAIHLDEMAIVTYHFLRIVLNVVETWTS